MSRNARSWLVVALVGVLAFAVGLAWGSSGWTWPWGEEMDASSRRIVLELRLPRTLGAALVGALLGLAGAIAQGVFRNPLADPFLLGSASGAAVAVAAALAIGASHAASAALVDAASAALVDAAGAARSGDALGATAGVTSAWIMNLAAFAGAWLAVLMTLALAGGAGRPMRLLVAGIAVGVVLGAVREGLTLVAPQTLRTMQAFMLGSTSFIDLDGCARMAVVLLFALLASRALARALDALALGDDTAASLGVRVAPARLAAMALLALGTAVAVAHAGLIAFIGLAAPHIARRAGHVQHAPQLAFAAAAGACLLLVADVAARIVTPPTEWPVGLVTAILGGGYLLVVLRREGEATR